MTEDLETNCRVYSYGCGLLPTATRRAIEDQLWLAHRYRYKLWQLNLAARGAYRDIRAILLPELLATESELDKAKELITLLGDKSLDAKERAANRKQLFLAKAEKERAFSKLKGIREKAKTNPAMREAITLIDARKNTLLKALRNVFSKTLGLYWCTYAYVEADARKANAGHTDPVKPVWRESGSLVCVPKGLTPVEVFLTNNNYVQITPITREGTSRSARSRTTAKYRISSKEKGKPVWVELPIVFHRKLPEDADIRCVKLVVKKLREGRFHYSLQFVLHSKSFNEKPQGAGVAALSFNNDKATVQCAYGEPKELPIGVDAGLVSKIRDLQSIRHKHLNEMIGLLNAWCERQDDIPEWFLSELESIKEGRSCRRLLHLKDKIRQLVDKRVVEHYNKWVYRENHLYWWQSDAQTKMLRNRSDRYRNIALDLRKQYTVLLIDSRKLNDPKLKTDQRNNAGLHDLKTKVKQSFRNNAIPVIGTSCLDILTNYQAAKP